MMIRNGKAIIDTDGNVYADAETFLTHACEIVSQHLKKYDGTEKNWWTWRQELCWWDEEVDAWFYEGDITEEERNKFIECLYGGLEKLGTHIW